MALALTPVYVNRTGTPVTTPVGVTPDPVTNTVANTGQTFLRLVCGATPVVVTVAQNATVDSIATAGRTYSLIASQDSVVGPFPIGTYGATLTITFANVTTVKVGVLECSGLS